MTVLPDYFGDVSEANVRLDHVTRNALATGNNDPIGVKRLRRLLTV